MQEVYTTTVEVKTSVRSLGYEVKPVHKTSVPFTRTARMNLLNDDHTIKPDLIDLINTLSRGALDLFTQIKRSTNPRNGTATLVSDELTRSQLNKRSTSYKELHAINLVKRVPVNGIKTLQDTGHSFKKHTFMINPDYIFPITDFEEDVRNIWNQLK